MARLPTLVLAAPAEDVWVPTVPLVNRHSSMQTMANPEVPGGQLRMAVAVAWLAHLVVVEVVDPCLEEAGVEEGRALPVNVVVVAGERELQVRLSSGGSRISCD